MLSRPAGFAACRNTENLYYRWEPVGLGSFFGCEYLGLTLVNGGRALAEVELRLTGRGTDGNVQFELRRNVHRIERGQSISLEIAPAEMPEVPQHLDVTVVDAKEPAAKESEEGRKPCQRPWWSSSAE